MTQYTIGNTIGTACLEENNSLESPKIDRGKIQEGEKAQIEEAYSPFIEQSASKKESMLRLIQAMMAHEE